MKRRGFTLIELMIGIAIGAFSVLVAAHVATVVVQQAARGRQKTDFNSRARVIGRQLRADIRLTGFGSTGAITADPNNPPWSTILAIQTGGGNTPNGGFPAFPAIIGRNNAGPVGGVPILIGSDVVQIVVVNPLVHAVTEAPASSGTSLLTMDPTADLAAFNQCAMIYIVDHSTPSGAGRTQIASFGGVAGNTIQILPDTLQFTVQPQSDVMCARVSTYWVADPDGDGLGNYLARSDLQSGAAPIPIGNGVNGLVIQQGPNDIVAPGVLDLQIAYSFSAEIYRADNQVPNPVGQWAYSGPPNPPLANLDESFDWFEARLVRFNIHARRMRAIDNLAPANLNIENRAEDGGAFAIPISRSLSPEILTTSETLINLRYFDYGTPSGVPAEPY